MRLRGIDKEKDTVMHYGGMDKKWKALILSNVKLNWRKRVVMTNTVVTAGIDFDVN